MAYPSRTARISSRQKKASALFLMVLALAFANETFDWPLVGTYDWEAILALTLVGCANNVGKSVVVKNTVAGLEVSSGVPQAPKIQFGLVRNFYVAVPTNATFTSDVDANIGATKESVREKLTIGVPPPPLQQAPATNATQSASLTNTVNVIRK